MMKFGLFGINMGPCSDPVTAVRVAQAAEAAGFESVWTGEHIVLPDPDPQVPASPVPSGIGHQSRRRLAQHLDPKSALLDPAVSLAFVAAHTQRLKLGTGIIILPQRNPLVLAKELASVAGLEQAARDLGRPGGLAEFEISVTPAVRLDPDTVRRYADLGVGRLIPFEGGGEKELLEFVARTGDTLIGRF